MKTVTIELKRTNPKSTHEPPKRFVANLEPVQLTTEDGPIMVHRITPIAGQEVGDDLYRDFPFFHKRIDDGAIEIEKEVWGYLLSPIHDTGHSNRFSDYYSAAEVVVCPCA